MSDIDLNRIKAGDSVKLQYDVFGESDWLDVKESLIHISAGGWTLWPGVAAVTVTAHRPSVASLKAAANNARKRQHQIVEDLQRLSEDLSQANKNLKQSFADLLERSEPESIRVIVDTTPGKLTGTLLRLTDSGGAVIKFDPKFGYDYSIYDSGSFVLAAVEIID